MPTTQDEFDRVVRRLAPHLAPTTDPVQALPITLRLVDGGLLDDLISAARAADWIDIAHEVLDQANTDDAGDRVFWICAAAAIARRVARALDEATAPVSHELRGSAWWTLAIAADRAGDHATDLEAWLEVAARAYVAAGDAEKAAQMLFNRGLAFHRLGRLSEALAAYAEAVALLRPLIEGGRDDLQVYLAAALADMASIHTSLDGRTDAEPAYAEAVAIYRRLVEGGRDDLQDKLAWALMDWIETVGLSSDRSTMAVAAYAEAEVLFRRLVDGGRDDLKSILAAVLADMASIHTPLDGRTEALAAYPEAIALLRQCIEDGRDDQQDTLASVLFKFAQTLNSLDRMTEAEPAYAEAVAIYRRLVEGGRDDLQHHLAWAQVNWAEAVGSNSDLTTEALAAYAEAVAIYRRLVESDRDDLQHHLAWALFVQGKLLNALGRFTEALAAYAEAVAIYRRLVESGRDDLQVDLALALERQGILLNSYYRSAEAIEAHAEALAIYRRLVEGGRDDLQDKLAWALMNWIHAVNSRRSAAGFEPSDDTRAVLAEVVAISRRLVEGGWDVLDALATTLLMQWADLAPDRTRTAEAETALAEAEALLRQQIEDGRDDLRYILATWIGVQGTFKLVVLHEPADALTAFAEVVAIYRRLVEGGRDDLQVDLARALTDLGETLGTLNRTMEARKAFDEAAKLFRVSAERDTGLDWGAQLRYACLLRSLDRLDEAGSAIDEAMRQVERLAAGIPSFTDRVYLRSSALDVYKLASRVAVERNDRAGAFSASQHAKGRTLAELHERRLEDAPEASTERRLAELAWEEYQTMVHSSDAQDGDTGENYFRSGAIATRDIGTIRAEREAIRLEMVVNRPNRALLVFGAVRSLDEVAAAIRPGEALLDLFDLGWDGLVASLILPGRAEIAWAALIDAGALVEALQWWEEALLVSTDDRQVPDDPDRWDDALAAVGELLLGEVLPLLRETGITHLIVGPSGRLHTIPFAALRVPDHKGQIRYLSEILSVSAIPTATSLWLLRQQDQPKGEPVLVAAAPFAPSDGVSTPVADEVTSLRREVRRGEEPRTLPGTKREVKQVARLVEQGREDFRTAVLLGTNATRSAVTALLPVARLALLATHGELSAEDQSRLGFHLLFRSGPDVVDRLDVRELFRSEVHLDGVFQIVLTGCHLGEVVFQGEEALGFTQAILSAGVGVVLAPLWAVDDDATCELSIAYHEELLSPERPTVAEAWRRAMARIRATPGWGHPYYWAAFLPQGDGSLRLAP